jgi:hypothetical protein
VHSRVVNLVLFSVLYFCFVYLRPVSLLFICGHVIDFYFDSQFFIRPYYHDQWSLVVCCGESFLNCYFVIVYVIWRRQCIPDDQTVVLLMLVTESRVTTHPIHIVTVCQDGSKVMLTVLFCYRMSIDLLLLITPFVSSNFSCIFDMKRRFS